MAATGSPGDAKATIVGMGVLRATSGAFKVKLASPIPARRLLKLDACLAE